MSKKTIIIVAIIALLAIGAVVWNQRGLKRERMSKPSEQNQANQDITDENTGEIDTSDWKTYKNENYGFKLKFPKEWRELNLANNFKGIGFGVDSNKHNLTVVYYENFRDLSWKTSEKPKDTFADYAKAYGLENLRKIDFHNSDAYIGVDRNDSIGYIGTAIIANHADHVYIITFSDVNELTDIDNKILTSFTFIEE